MQERSCRHTSMATFQPGKIPAARREIIHKLVAVVVVVGRGGAASHLARETEWQIKESRKDHAASYLRKDSSRSWGGKKEEEEEGRRDGSFDEYLWK